MEYYETEDGNIYYEDDLVPPQAVEKLKEKNSNLWKILWAALLGFFWIKAFNKKSNVDDIRNNEYAKKYFLDNGLQFVKDMTETDIQRLRLYMINNWGKSAEEFAQILKDSYLCSETRLKLIYRNEIHKAMQSGSISAALDKNKKVKTRHCKHENSCLLCMQIDGETVPIDGYFSDGTYDAHTHIGCRCELEFGDEMR